MAEAPLEPEVGGGMARVDWNPSTEVLQQFGWAVLGFCGIMWLFFSRSLHPGPGWLVFFAVGIAAAGLAIFSPKRLKGPFVGVSLATFPIGLILGEILFFIVFFLVVTPVALWFRMMGRDSLHRRFEPSATTYWTIKRRPNSIASYFRQS